MQPYSTIKWIEKFFRPRVVEKRKRNKVSSLVGLNFSAKWSFRRKNWYFFAIFRVTRIHMPNLRTETNGHWKISIGFIVPSGNPFSNIIIIQSFSIYVNKRSFSKCVVSAILSSFPLFTTLPLQINCFLHTPTDRPIDQTTKRPTGWMICISEENILICRLRRPISLSPYTAYSKEGQQQYNKIIQTIRHKSTCVHFTHAITCYCHGHDI